MAPFGIKQRLQNRIEGDSFLFSSAVPGPPSPLSGFATACSALHRRRVYNPLVNPQTSLSSVDQTRERNWLPMAIAAVAVILVAAVVVLVLQARSASTNVSAVNASPDAYASSLPISSMVMSEAANLSGGKVTYVDGHIVNKGSQTVTGITVQVLFRNYAHEVTQNVTQPLMLIRMRQPYIDVGPVSTAPLKPGDERDFRLIFDPVKEDWDGAYPEIRITHVDLH